MAMAGRSGSSLVSVIIPAYNAARFIGAAIDSVFAQSYPAVELIVVDDGSTDQTAEVVGGYGDRVRYVYQQNARQAAARNRGLREARGELIAFLDADDVWLPEKLVKQVALLDVEPHAGLIFCGMRLVDSEGRVLKDSGADLGLDPVADILLGRMRGGGIGSTALVPRKVIEEVGDFDSSLPPCEDTDLLWRIAARYPIRRVDEALVLYRQHASNAHTNIELMSRAWKLLYGKALRDPAIRRLGWAFRLRCLARLNYMLAGDHWHAGRRVAACCYGVHACLRWPPIALRALGRLVPR